MSDRLPVKSLVHLLEQYGLDEGYTIINGNGTTPQGNALYEVAIKNADEFNHLAKVLGIRRVERRQETARGIPPVRLYFGHKGWTIYSYQPHSG